MSIQNNRSGGRNGGRLTRRKISLQERIFEYDDKFDPIIELIKIYQNEETITSDKISVLKEIASYMYPKLKSIETNSNSTNVNIDYQPSTEDIVTIQQKLLAISSGEQIIIDIQPAVELLDIVDIEPDIVDIEPKNTLDTLDAKLTTKKDKFKNNKFKNNKKHIDITDNSVNYDYDEDAGFISYKKNKKGI